MCVHVCVQATPVSAGGSLRTTISTDAADAGEEPSTASNSRPVQAQPASPTRAAATAAAYSNDGVAEGADNSPQESSR
jgi:hypothetical protein